METNKKKLKNPINYLIDLNEEQAAAKEIISNSKITVLKGMAGSGKSLVAIQAALDALFKKEVSKIILSRPTVTAGEELGILPGGVDDKLEPYVAPLMDALYSNYHRDKIDALVKDKKIQIMPVGVMRGRNLSDCVVVIDESQNITDVQTKLILTRLCKGSKFIFCGDNDQIDLDRPWQSGFDFLCDAFREIPNFSVIELKENHRDEIVKMLLEIYAQREFDKKNKN